VDLEKVRELIELVSESGLSELTLKEGEDSVRLVKRCRSQSFEAQAVETTRRESSGASSLSLAAGKREVTAASSEPEPLSSARRVFKAPMVGTFYRAAAPDAPPFVEVGSEVEIGQSLAVIEAMKLLNEVESDVVGRLTEILVENGAFVELGQPLFTIE
jgi:acetyl-CoA carboxylase biotin carboxyl carrier protein